MATYPVKSLTIAKDGNSYLLDVVNNSDLIYTINGNTPIDNIAVGMHVRLINSTITDCTDGVYITTKAITANTAIDKTYISAVSVPLLNDVDSTKADKTDTVLNTTLSRGRKANSTIGTASFAFGDSVIASGNKSHAEGTGGSYISSGTTYESGSKGDSSHSEGYQTIANNQGSHSEGFRTRAFGIGSHAEGFNTITGENTSAAHAEGLGGIFTINGTSYISGAYSNSSHTEGFQTYVGPNAGAAHAEGQQTIANAPNAHAEGQQTIANAQSAHAEGVGGSFTFGGSTYISGANGIADHTEGQQTYTGSNGTAKHAEGYYTIATGHASHAEGGYVKAEGIFAHGEGNSTRAIGFASHAEGQGGTFSLNGSSYTSGATESSDHTEGYMTFSGTAGSAHHAEGYCTVSLGHAGHTEGQYTMIQPSAAVSHAEGDHTIANGNVSHVEGYYTTADGPYMHVSGKYNYPDNYNHIPQWTANTSYNVGDIVQRNNYFYKCKTANSDASFTSANWTQIMGLTKHAEVIGNGEENNLSNARALGWDGNEYLKGTLYVGCNADSTGGSAVLTTSMKGAVNGVAELDSSGKVPSNQLPSYVDDVLEYTDLSSFPVTGETGKIYVASDTGKTYRWSGSAYVELSSYAEATTSASGLMSSTDKAKLDGIATGATANTGTITGITMNGTSKGTSGVVDLGTVLTAHQDISGKVEIAQGSTNEGKIMRVNSSGNLELDKTMAILSYGTSTWNDFLVAYNTQSVVYCKASSNSNPATGTQGRMAFMAYVGFDGSGNLSNVEFQYYRSVNSHSDNQQGDQVFIYKLTSAGEWTVTTRNAFSKVVAGTNMSSSYSNGVITLNSTLESKVAASGGTDLSLVTTGEKYAWNNVTDSITAITNNEIDALFA